MKENTHKEPKQKPSGRVPKEHATNRLPKTLAREAWLKSKEKAISATRTRSDSDYASAQEMEEYAVQQAEDHLEDGALFALRKTGTVVRNRFTRKNESDEPPQDDPMYRDAPEPGEKKATARENSGSDPQANAKKEQKRHTAQKQSRDVRVRQQRIKKSTRGVRGVDRDQKQLRTAANTARKEKQARQAAQRTQRTIYRAQQAARESADAAKKVIAVIRSAIQHLLAALQSLAAALIAGGWVTVFVILLICLIALVVGSAYGIFFAAESPDENAISVQNAVEQLTEEYRDRLEEIENSVDYDRQEIESNDGSYAIAWQDVLAVFASQTSGDANGAAVAYLDEDNMDRLCTVFWDMNELDWRTESQTQEVEQTNEEGETETTTITETVLIIELTHHTSDEMRDIYCATCGRRMTSSNPGKGAKRDKAEYICYMGANHRNNCNGQRSYVAKRVEDIVLQATRLLLDTIKDTPRDESVEARVQAEMKELKYELRKTQQQVEEAAKEQEGLEMEVSRCLLGKSNFTTAMLSRLIDDKAQERRELENKALDLERRLKNETEMSEKVAEYYNRFLGWSMEFGLATIERKRIIISQLYKRIELGRGYVVNFEVDWNYKQFIDTLELEQHMGITEAGIPMPPKVRKRSTQNSNRKNNGAA